MNRVLAIGLVLTYTAALSLAAEPERVAFERGTAIWIANVDGSKAEKITEGSGPSLSPDGTQVAFNTDDSTARGLVRELAIAEVATKKVTLVNGIPSKNCQRAQWSPDGKQILFTIWSGDDWDISLVRPDGSGFRYVKKSEPPKPEKTPGLKMDTLWSTCWAMDGKSIFSQDLEYLHQIDLQGAELKKWKLDSLFPGGGMNSNSRMASSPDGKTLLVEVDMDEEVKNMPDWDGPPPSLWSFDPESAKATRLTEKGKLAASGCWLDKSHILFNVFSPKEKQPAIYEMELGKKEMKLVLKNGVSPSARAAGGGGN